jgi:hypothetical protein
MSSRNVVHYGSFFILPIIIFSINLKIAERAPVDVDWGLMCLVATYCTLLAILKFHAAQHRKVKIRQSLNNDVKSNRKIQMYLQEVFKCEAKMSPVSSPLLSNLWAASCYIVFCILYPRPLAACHLAVFLIPFCVEVLMCVINCDESIIANGLIYNGRRYRIVWWGVYYSYIQDEELNSLYYPTAGLCGLIPLDVHE